MVKPLCIKCDKENRDDARIKGNAYSSLMERGYLCEEHNLKEGEELVGTEDEKSL